MILTAKVGEQQAGMRLDAGAALLFPDLSKSRIRTIIDWGGCTVGGALVRVASRTLREGEDVVLGVMEPERCREICYRKEDLLYEDRGYLAINKEAGLNSQRTPYQLKGTVEYGVTLYLRSLGLKEEARVIHRLDRGTSGVMFFPKHKQAATHISWQLKNGEVNKVYWAVVADIPEQEEWVADLPIGKLNKFRYGVALPGKPARTLFRVIASGAGAVLVEARPMTGRTHQIRVHLAHAGLPIMGDVTYGGASAPRMMLHCRSMAFRDAKGLPVAATAPLDDLFRDICTRHGIDPNGFEPGPTDEP